MTPTEKTTPAEEAVREHLRTAPAATSVQIEEATGIPESTVRSVIRRGEMREPGKPGRPRKPKRARNLSRADAAELLRVARDLGVTPAEVVQAGARWIARGRTILDSYAEGLIAPGEALTLLRGMTARKDAP